MTPEEQKSQLPLRMQKRISLIIFDLDGVITSEKIYWNASRLTLWKLIEDNRFVGLKGYFGIKNASLSKKPELREKIVQDNTIYELKRRAINSNWDKTFLLASLHLAGIISSCLRSSSDHKRTISHILDNSATMEGKLYELGQYLQNCNYTSSVGISMINDFLVGTNELTGANLLNSVRLFVNQQLGLHFEFLEPKGDFWQLCYLIFQEFYRGEALSLHSFQLEEETVLDRRKIATTLKILHESGKYKLGIATGRPLDEVTGPLTAFGLLEYFDTDRIVTYDNVLDAEKQISQPKKKFHLGKPHPFVILKAIYPDRSADALCLDDYAHTNHTFAVVVGDSSSDIIAAKKANCIAIGVLTDIGSDKSRIQNKLMELTDCGCDVVLESILELPCALGIEIKHA